MHSPCPADCRGMRLLALAFVGIASLLQSAYAAQPHLHPDRKAPPPIRSGFSASSSLRYLISTFPTINTVAYTHLPDTVWRPLYVVNTEKPMAVVACSVNERLYVADTVLNKIFWYKLLVEGDGLLKTDGVQRVAVNDVTAYWMAVNGVGDLYFTGEKIVKPPASSYRAVYRMDASTINSGNAINMHEIYSRSNSGFPAPRAWLPSGIAVDSFNVYWGNEEKGKNNGAVCSGTRQNIGVTSGIEINVVSRAINEVRGVAVTGQSVFFLSKDGVYGTDKQAWSDVIRNPDVGLIQEGPTTGLDPVSLAYDGENTMYWTEARHGVIYSLPAQDTNPHPFVKYVDAPLVHGVTVYSLTGLSQRQVFQDQRLQSSAVVEDSGIRRESKLCVATILMSALATIAASCQSFD